jgi:O-antigen/teichoic acid export membrane protein
MNVYRYIFRQSAVYSGGMALVKLSSVFLLRVYTSYLSPSDYGVMELLDLTSYVLIMLIGLRLGDALIYCYFQTDDEAGRRIAVSTAVFGAIVLGTAVAISAGTIARPISLWVFGSAEQAPYFRLVLATLAVSLPLEASNAYLRALNKPGAVTKLVIGRAVVSMSVTLVLMTGFQFRVTSLLWGTFVSSLATGVVLTVYVFRKVGLQFDRKLFLQQYRYAVPLGVGGIGMLFINYGDRFFLLRSSDLAAVGIYALGYKLGMLVSYLYEPFSMYWNSQVYMILKQPGGERIYTRTMTYLVLVLTSAALVLSVFAEPAITVLTTPAFHGAAGIVPLIATAYVLRGAGDHVRRVFMVENRTELELGVNLAATAACLLAYSLLIPSYKSTGAAVATVAAFLVTGTVGFWQAQRVRKFLFETRRLAMLFGSAVSMLCVRALLHPKGFWPQIWIGAACTLGFVLVLLAARFPEKDEVEAIRSHWVRFTRRLVVTDGN